VTEFEHDVSSVAALADPTRRRLYLFVVAQPEPVSRDDASAGVGIARHTAKFHLDKLVDEGLLSTQFKRTSGRRGPGAGRPAKLYARSERQVAVTLPQRQYDLAGQLMARAIEESVRDGTDVIDALHAAAAAAGAALGAQARQDAGERPGSKRLRQATCRALESHGYEPRDDGPLITLENCPFDALAREHTTLVCGMNLALLTAVIEQLGETRLAAGLAPDPARCCVVLTDQ
jgi:predicted ArsR family transcriptional regulator